MNIKKIYVGDPLIKFDTTTLSRERTKAQIDNVLAQYQVKDIYWHLDYTFNSVYVMFKLEETVNDIPVNVSIRVDCPTIWNKARLKRRPYTEEDINWDVSMRAMYHFIYTHLNAAYAMQSSKVLAFLGYIQTGKEGESLKDLILPKLNNLASLEDKSNIVDERKIIDVTEYKKGNE